MSAAETRKCGLALVKSSKMKVTLLKRRFRINAWKFKINIVYVRWIWFSFLCCEKFVECFLNKNQSIKPRFGKLVPPQIETTILFRHRF